MSKSTARSARWDAFERWSPTALAIGGVGSLTVVAISVLEIALYGQRFELIPEWGIPIITVPTLFATFVGLFGFYPYVSGHAPRLSLGGALAAAIGGTTLIVTVLAGLLLNLLRVIAFTALEEMPVFVGALILMMLTLLLSFLLFGVASTLTKRPSRTIGLLLLVPIVEPLFTILFDVLLSIEIPGGPLGTLAIEGLALLAVGYILQTAPEPTDHAEPTPTEVRHD